MNTFNLQWNQEFESRRALEEAPSGLYRPVDLAILVVSEISELSRAGRRNAGVSDPT